MKRSLWSILLAMILLAGGSIAAAAPVVLDVDKAKETVGRANHDPVEGVWAVSQQWDPLPKSKQARAYRLVIVRNNHGVFKDAKYLGLVVCAQKEGLTKGEVKLLLSPTGEKGKFRATWHTGKGNVQGVVILQDDDYGAADSAIDMRALKWGDHVLMNWLGRIVEK